MDALYEIKGKTLIIYMPEEVDHHIAEQINDESDWFVTTNNVTEIIFDFAKTEFMDSSGIGIIMGKYRILSKLDGKIHVKNANRTVDRMLTISGINRVLSEQYEWERGKLK